MMTFCLTFDDGLKDHYEIVAPLLERHGWRGVFNVPTRVLSAELDAIQNWAKDCELEGHEDNRMTWDDARDLVKRGHEVYPHTCDHVNLLKLEEAGEKGEVVRQIVESKASFEKEMGYKPLFFCSPHNQKSPFILSVLRKNGMELFECFRENFGKIIPYVYQGSITQFLIERESTGYPHVDIMIHGVDAQNGGWAPFASRDAFASFLDEIAVLEKNGVAHVVSYAESHRKPGFFTPIMLFGDRVYGRFRREVFRCLKFR